MKKYRTEWEKLKHRGSYHYKKDPSKIEPIDLYRDGGMLRDFALANIMKYAYRNRASLGKDVSLSDMEKIKHYADMVIVCVKDSLF